MLNLLKCKSLLMLHMKLLLFNHLDKMDGSSDSRNKHLLSER